MRMEKGNIYLGQVHSVAVSYSAAFVDYGSERDGYLPFDEIENQYKTKKNRETGEKIIRRDTIVVVQVKKPAVPGKGALLTTRLSYAGEYVAFMPHRTARGLVSRKIEDDQEKERLQQIASDLSKKYQVSIIVRTEAMGKSKHEIEKDLEKLIELDKRIQEKSQKVTAPALLFEAPQEEKSQGLLGRFLSKFKRK